MSLGARFRINFSSGNSESSFNAPNRLSIVELHNFIFYIISKSLQVQTYMRALGPLQTMTLVLPMGSTLCSRPKYAPTLLS